ncbi:ammonium transporter [Antrihabitans sp. YC2-6]|uniref:ammonium transporter n=1 Tax=Antrihabitans sp. YC2-6 TaxID=2799498 RepID=UPI0018F7C7E6|nr:ammonium transporter [Antrihabitans sp. YC2-6]MBJ8348679.1 ammonium transporter [Antrihabitans sp. YC2-6]
MMLRKTVALAAMVIGAMGVASGTTYAEPVTEPSVINYESRLVDKTVVTDLVGGTFEIDPDAQLFAVKDSAGNAVLTVPLAFSIDQVAHPLLPVVSNAGKTLSLTPDMDPAKAMQVAVTPVASPLENQRAQDSFLTELALATTVGGLVGTALGVVAGAIGGCLLGLPFFGVGCIPAAIVGATIGGILGTVIAGGPTVIAAGQELINTLNAPPGTTKWNYPDRIIVVPQA